MLYASVEGIPYGHKVNGYEGLLALDTNLEGVPHNRDTGNLYILNFNDSVRQSIRMQDTKCNVDKTPVEGRVNSRTDYDYKDVANDSETRMADGNIKLGSLTVAKSEAVNTKENAFDCPVADRRRSLSETGVINIAEAANVDIRQIDVRLVKEVVTTIARNDSFCPKGPVTKVIKKEITDLPHMLAMVGISITGSMVGVVVT